MLVHNNRSPCIYPLCAMGTHQHNYLWHSIKTKSHKQELRNGIYKPRLTIAHRMELHGYAENTLKIELSLSKQMFGNNFDELQYKDFTPLVHKLVDVLSSMGVKVSTESIAHAPVIAIHY